MKTEEYQMMKKKKKSTDESQGLITVKATQELMTGKGIVLNFIIMAVLEKKKKNNDMVYK